MHVGRTIRGFISLASAKICSTLGLDESTLWNLFGLLGRRRQVAWHSLQEGLGRSRL